jgi:uncharacterized protein YdhG (YjbR/CyaY superfamily)
MTVEAYLQALAPDAKATLATLLDAVCEVLPEGVPVISYGIPTVKVDGRAVVHVAAWKRFASLYPLPPFADTELEARVAPYRAAKATARFPYGEPLPLDVIADVVRALAQRP